MTCIHIAIEQQEGRRFHVQSDNMRREDATPEEITFTNQLESIIGEMVKLLAEEVLRFDKTQKEPCD
jgi:hypothetical protein